MNIGCVYTIQTTNEPQKPLSINEIPFGISFVATSLQNAGFHPQLLVFTPQSDFKTLLHKFIRENKPPLFCLTAVASQILLISSVAEEIKKIDPTIFIVLGGVHATLNPEELIKNQYFDAICVGEGEKAICDLAYQIQNSTGVSGIPHLWIKQQESKIEKNEPLEFIQDLDSLPFIDREMWHTWVYDRENSEQSILISRGCPNKCSYCSNHVLSKISNGRYVRFRTPLNIITEIKEILKKYPHICSIWLESETISMNLTYCHELLRVLTEFNDRREKKIRFRTNISLSRKILNQDFFTRLSKANVDYVNIGLESGSEYIRKTVLRRPVYSNEDIRIFCQFAKQYNIKVLFFVILGLPEETITEYYQTIECIRACVPDVVSKYLFYPYPGTDLYEMAKAKGLLSDCAIFKTGQERTQPTLNIPGFSKKRQQIEYILFEYRIYQGRLPLKQILKMTIANICRIYPDRCNIIKDFIKKHRVVQ